MIEALLETPVWSWVGEFLYIYVFSQTMGYVCKISSALHDQTLNMEAPLGMAGTLVLREQAARTESSQAVSS